MHVECWMNPLNHYFICDLGLSKKHMMNLQILWTRLRKNKVSVTYIDHHDIDPNVVIRH